MMRFIDFDVGFFSCPPPPLTRKTRALQQQQPSTTTHPPNQNSDVGLPRAAVVGVLGGGQLGRMLAQEAVKMGVRLRVLDPTMAEATARPRGAPRPQWRSRRWALSPTRTTSPRSRPAGWTS